MLPFCPLLTLLIAFNFPVNAAESDKSEVWWKNLRQWSSWNHTLTSSDFWDMLWNQYAQLGCMGLIELCDIKRMRLILLQIFFYFGSFFLGLKVSRIGLFASHFRCTSQSHFWYLWNMFHLNESAVLCLSFPFDHPPRPRGTWKETCKVTDFGMARDVQQENIYER